MGSHSRDSFLISFELMVQCNMICHFVSSVVLLSGSPPRTPFTDDVQYQDIHAQQFKVVRENIYGIHFPTSAIIPYYCVVQPLVARCVDGFMPWFAIRAQDVQIQQVVATLKWGGSSSPTSSRYSCGSQARQCAAAAAVCFLQVPIAKKQTTHRKCMHN